MAEDEYTQLMYFYRSFFKEIMGEAMDLMGRRGILAILRVASKKFANSKIENYAVAQTSFETAIKILLNLGKPEMVNGGTSITLGKCPFKTRPGAGQQILEEDVFCSICKGFVNGVSEYFNMKPMILKESRIRRAKKCLFEAM